MALALAGKHVEGTNAVNPVARSRGVLWAGRVVSALVILFLGLDAVAKVLRLAPVIEGTVQLGFAASAVRGIGIALLCCVVLYAVPRTAVLGAILVTGYLGGAVAVQARLGQPLLGYTLFPVYVAVLAWGGLFLRDARLRALLPLRARESARRAP